MNLDLLTLLENIVSGFVSFFYSLFRSLFETARHPIRGPFRLYRLYRAPRSRQIGAAPVTPETSSIGAPENAGAPPDTNGAVGATQYVQWVNTSFAVFNKTTGASVLGPSGITTLWSGFGGVCQTNGFGDPVMLYDKMANRWLISEFAGPTSFPDHECIAVSTTSDATGSYNRYDFDLTPFGINFYDYPKLGSWPDAYYMAMNVFNSAGTAFLGVEPFAFDRTQMLSGLPATVISPGLVGAPAMPARCCWPARRFRDVDERARLKVESFKVRFKRINQ